MGSSLQVRGVSELKGKLRQNVQMSDVKKVVKNNTIEMTNRAKREAPVETGHLKNSITMSIEGGGLTGKTTSGANYAGYQEYGTRFQSGKPHIRPAYNKQKEQFKKDMDRLMK